MGADEDVLSLARAFREGDDQALVRLVGALARGTRALPFRERLLEFVRPAAEDLVKNNVERVTITVCPLCLLPQPDTWHETADGRPRLVATKPVIALTDDFSLLSLCHQCFVMRDRHPEVVSYLSRSARSFWRLAGAPPEIMR